MRVLLILGFVMALSVKVAGFNWSQSDAAGTNYDVTLGFQPTFVILSMSGMTGTTDAVARGRIVQIMGFGASPTNRRNVCYTVDDAVGTMILFNRHSDVSILSFSDRSLPGADSDGDLDIAAVVNWPSDGIRFTVDTQINSGYGAGASFRVTVIAVGGSDILEANTFAFQEPGSSGAQAVAHGLGGTPTGALFITSGSTGAPPVDAETPSQFCFGASDGSDQFLAWIGGDDGNTNADCRSYALSGEVIALGSEPPVTLDARASVSSFDSTNINLNWAERAATRYIHCLVWRGGQFNCGSATTATDTTPFNGPTNGFTATLAMFASCCRAASSSDTPTDHSQLSIGAATSASERAAQSCTDQDGVGTSEVARALELDEVYIQIDTADAVVGLMDVSDASADPWVLVMDDADPSAAFVGVASWGATGGGGGGGSTLPIRRRTLLGVGA